MVKCSSPGVDGEKSRTSAAFEHLDKSGDVLDKLLPASAFILETEAAGLDVALCHGEIIQAFYFTVTWIEENLQPPSKRDLLLPSEEQRDAGLSLEDFCAVTVFTLTD